MEPPDGKRFVTAQFEEHEGKLPPFYFTVLIPLGVMDETNGATEIIGGSHRKGPDRIAGEVDTWSGSKHVVVRELVESL